MGFDARLFTRSSSSPRIAGWAAHALKQITGNRLMRPLARYVGSDRRDLPE
jgi:citrate synthase